MFHQSHLICFVSSVSSKSSLSASLTSLYLTLFHLQDINMASFKILSQLLQTQLALPGINIYLLRHGQSLGNHAGSIVGWADSKLSVKGREQANQMYRAFYPHVDTFTHIHSSDLSRARDTLDLSLGFPNKTYLLSKQLRQLDFGDDDGVHFDSLPQSEKEKVNSIDYHAPNGESWLQAKERAMGYLGELKEGQHLVGSHGGLMCALAHHLGLKHVVTNCSVVSVSLCPQTKQLNKLNFVWEFENQPSQ